MHITATMHKRLRKKPKKYYVNFALVILQMRGEWNFQEYNKTHKHSGNAKWKKKEKIHIKQETHWMYPTWRCFRTSFSFFRLMIFEKKNLKDLHFIFLVRESLTTHCGSHPTPGVMIWTNLNLPHLRMLPYKIQINFLAH